MVISESERLNHCITHNGSKSLFYFLLTCLQDIMVEALMTYRDEQGQQEAANLHHTTSNRNVLSSISSPVYRTLWLKP